MFYDESPIVMEDETEEHQPNQVVIKNQANHGGYSDQVDYSQSLDEPEQNRGEGHTPFIDQNYNGLEEQ